MSTNETEPAITPEPNTGGELGEISEEGTPEPKKAEKEVPAKKETSWYPIALALLLVAALLVGLGFYFNRTAPTPEERLETTRQYTEVANAVALLPDTKPGQVLLAPPTSDWWGKVLRFGRDTAQLNRLAFDEYKEGAEYVAFVLSPGDNYNQPSGFGLPTFMIAYETAEQATAASEKLSSNQPSDEEGGPMRHYLRDRLMIFTPPGSFADKDYPVEQFEEGESQVSEDLIEEDLFEGGTRAVWQFNFNEFRQIVLANSSEESRQAYDQIISSLNVTDAASFMGTSTDLLDWEGRFYDLNLTSIPNPEVVTELLGSYFRLGLNDGSLITSEQLNEKPELEDQLSGRIFSGLSELLFYTQISAQTQAAGNLVSYETGQAVEAEVLTPTEGLFRIKFSPNMWIGYLTGLNEEVPASYFADATVTILDGEGNATIDFTDFSEIKVLQEEVTESEPAEAEVPAESEEQ